MYIYSSWNKKELYLYIRNRQSTTKIHVMHVQHHTHKQCLNKATLYVVHTTELQGRKSGES